VSARPFAGDPPAVWPIHHLHDAPDRRTAMVNRTTSDDVQFVMGCCHRASSFPVLFFNGVDSKTNSPFFNSTVTRLWSRISPATACAKVRFNLALQEALEWPRAIRTGSVIFFMSSFFLLPPSIRTDLHLNFLIESFSLNSFYFDYSYFRSFFFVYLFFFFLFLSVSFFFLLFYGVYFFFFFFLIFYFIPLFFFLVFVFSLLFLIFLFRYLSCFKFSLLFFSNDFRLLYFFYFFSYYFISPFFLLLSFSDS